MPDKPTFVVNDRRKFTSEGELRHDQPVESSADATAAENSRGPQLVTEPSTPAVSTSELADLPEAGAIADLYPDQPSPADPDPTAEVEEDTYLDEAGYPDEGALPPGPTAEQASEAARAYEATAERLDMAMRAANPGADRMPPMSFERLVQSLYTQALILLGGGAQPGETPRVDILGAKETIDMLVILADKSKGNLSDPEDKLLQSALFDLRMGFLEITQALARQAAQRQGPGNPAGMPPTGPGGPRIVR